MTDLFAKLKAEFPRDKIHWRAQSVTKDGKKAMALAYIDARDVMERLDEACGPDGWQCEHFPAGGDKLGCKIGIRGQLVTQTTLADWVWKSDGAGETQVEGEKGAFSGAFKRAAVMWGIGRYLYDMPAPWVACESYEKNGKMHWKSFTDDPWKHVKDPGHIYGPLTKTKLNEALRAFAGSIQNVTSSQELVALQQEYEVALKQCMDHHPAWWDRESEEHPGLKQRILERQEYFDMNRQTNLDAG